jgi:hypothetical protein
LLVRQREATRQARLTLLPIDDPRLLVLIQASRPVRRQRGAGGLGLGPPGARTGVRPALRHRSHLSTTAKHGLDCFDALVMLTNGGPLMPAVT